ncbi:MAG: Hpt domain-containing protein [Pararhodobacter sp.]|nr:Hpt domain-containing protein [Pararhodobacter sp.]
MSSTALFQRDLYGNDPETVQSFQTAFRDASPELAIQLAGEVSASDAAEAPRIAHLLKLSTRWIGARTLGDLCKEIENLVKAGDGAQLFARLAGLIALQAAVLAEIAQFCAEDGG